MVLELSDTQSLRQLSMDVGLPPLLGRYRDTTHYDMAPAYVFDSAGAHRSTELLAYCPQTRLGVDLLDRTVVVVQHSTHSLPTPDAADGERGTSSSFNRPWWFRS